MGNRCWKDDMQSWSPAEQDWCSCIEEVNICEIVKTFDGGSKTVLKIIPRQALL